MNSRSYKTQRTCCVQCPKTLTSLAVSVVMSGLRDLLEPDCGGSNPLLSLSSKLRSAKPPTESSSAAPLSLADRSKGPAHASRRISRPLFLCYTATISFFILLFVEALATFSPMLQFFHGLGLVLFLVQHARCTLTVPANVQVNVKRIHSKLKF